LLTDLLDRAAGRAPHHHVVLDEAIHRHSGPTDAVEESGLRPDFDLVAARIGEGGPFGAVKGVVSMPSGSTPVSYWPNSERDRRRLIDRTNALGKTLEVTRALRREW
jgi:hypothetical protein